MNAREAALAATLARDGRPLEEELRRRLTQVPERDRGLARELLAGTVRRRRSLDLVIDHFTRRRPPQLPVREILRQAIYQLLFLDRVPDHAAIHASVALAKERAPRAAGFVNAMLRNLQRAPIERGEPSAQSFAVSPEVGVRVSGLDLADATTDPIANLGQRYSYPDELVSRWHEHLGAAGCEAQLAAGNAVHPLSLRTNLRRTTRDELVARLVAGGYEAVEGAGRAGVLVTGGGDPRTWPGFDEGWFTAQGEAAQSVVPALELERAKVVVDLCAAPGGKATHVLELLGAAGQLHCVDVDEDRLQRVVESVQRLVLAPPIIHVVDARAFQLSGKRRADRVLVDAPCSNTGVLARRLEARWRFAADQLESLAAISQSLLEHGLELLAPGGRLAYSTCSLEPEENRDVIQSVLDSRRDVRELLSREMLPSEHHGDGGFVCVLEFAP